MTALISSVVGRPCGAASPASLRSRLQGRASLSPLPPALRTARPYATAGRQTSRTSGRATVAQAVSEDQERASSASTTATPGISDVEVRVYNIDRYGFAPIASKALRKKVDGIFHVAVAVYGVEYWYDHQINQVSLDEVEFCRGFGPMETYNLGWTNVPQAEFEEWLYSTVQDEYTIDKYDCFNHNCHHFANELALKLTDGREGIPQWCIDHGEKGLEMMPDAQAEKIKNVSNKIARIMMVSWGRYSQQRFRAKTNKELSDTRV